MELWMILVLFIFLILITISTVLLWKKIVSKKGINIKSVLFWLFFKSPVLEAEKSKHTISSVQQANEERVDEIKPVEDNQADLVSADNYLPKDIMAEYQESETTEHSQFDGTGSLLRPDITKDEKPNSKNEMQVVAQEAKQRIQVFCIRCGQENTLQAKFCFKCGNKLI
jgi:ribosomal protein L40E